MLTRATSRGKKPLPSDAPVRTIGPDAPGHCGCPRRRESPLAETTRNCRDCGAWVLARAEACPVCGIVAPASRLLGRARDNQEFWLGVGAATGLGAGLLAAVSTGWWPLWLVGPLGGFALGRGWLSQRLRHAFDHRVTAAVRPRRDRCEARRAELEEALRRIDTLRHRIATEVAPHHRSPALHALQQAEEATLHRRDRCVVEAFELRVLEWQNRLQPLHRGWRRFDEATCQRHLHALDAAIANGRALVARWREAPPAATPAGQLALDRLGRLLGACGQLRQALLVRQAAALTAEAPGVREAFGTDTLPADATADIDILLDTGGRLGLRAALRAAADEAQRLRAELDAVADVERLVAGAPQPLGS